jgi:hypothetical protein
MTRARSTTKPSPTWRIHVALACGVALLTEAGSSARALAAPPPETATPAAGSGARREGAVEAARLRANLEAARLAAKDDPRASAPLVDAIAEAEANPALLRGDPELRDARSLARLELARAALARGEQEAALTATDDALRLEPDAIRFADRLGPSIASLVRARASETSASATIDVTCTTPCTVFIDEHPRAPGPVEVLPGGHRLFVDGAGAIGLALALDLGPGDRHVTTWPIEVADRAAAAEVVTPPAPARLLPRGAEIALFTVGLGLAAAGSALIVIDGRCPGGDDPSDLAACPNVYATRPAGGATLALGITGALTGLIPLAMDEARQARHRKATRRALAAEAKALSRR